MRRRLPALLLAVAAPAAQAGAAQDPAAAPRSPSEYLGRPLAADFQLPDWDVVRGYFEELGAASPHLQWSRVGTSTEGRPFGLAVISGTQNLGRLEELQAHAATLADPRGKSDAQLQRARREGRLFLMIACNMHSTETASPQFAMQLAWTLATSDAEPWRRAREELVVLLMPTINPDGLDHVAHWYAEHVGGPYEGSSLVRLYQYYAGHDNNRDWFALTQEETRIVTRLLYREWHPQVYWDVHEQGNRAERFFVPPFRDPLNPRLDAHVIAGIDALGSRALWDLTRAGLTGVSTGVSYDMWWNGGNRNVPVRHNVIGLLTEAASVDIASPVWRPRSSLRPPRGLEEYAPSHRFPAPWPGGWWRLRDVVDYEMAFARSLVGSLTREPGLYVDNALAAAERNVERARGLPTRAWLLPSDSPDRRAARRLAGILLQSGIELHAAQETLAADGRHYPAGTLVIPMDQPYATHVQDLFALQRYPRGAPPYDVAGWTLPLLFGLRRVEVREEMSGALQPVGEADAAAAGFPGRAPESAALAGMRDAADGDAWAEVLAAARAAGDDLSFLPAEDALWMSPAAQAPAAGSAGTLPGEPPVRRALPRVGVYAPWRGSMDEGWLRWVLDDYGLEYRTVRNEMLRAGRLADFLDVLVIPSVGPWTLDEGRRPGTVPPRYQGGLDPEGAVAVEEFVRGGGRLLCLGASTDWAVELFDLPLRDAAEDPDFSCPGSVVRTVPGDSLLTAGLPASVPVFFSRSAAWTPEEDLDEEQAGAIEVLLRYAPTRTLLSGYMAGAAAVAGKPAWLRVRHGAGAVHLFGFRPQYRGWSEAAFRLLFRALYLDG